MQKRHVILMIIIASLGSFGIGFSLALLYQGDAGLFGQTGSSIIPFFGLIGGGLAIWQAITGFLKENVLEYAGIYRKTIEHTRVVPSQQLGQRVERQKRTAFFLRIRKKKGSGQVQNCEGLIQVEGTGIRRYAVWEGEHRYISIGIQGDLELFEFSRDNFWIIFPSRTDDATNFTENRQPNNPEFLGRTLSVIVAASNGTVPSKPFTSTIKNVIEQTMPESLPMSS